MSNVTKRLIDLPDRGKIWIDLDNSPHVPFFAPIIQELRRLGFSLLLTARDCFQVCALAELHNLVYRKIGHHYGKHLVFKLYGLGVRAVQLAPLVLKEEPILAVSHGSRSQLLLSQLLGIPTLTICDYEFAKNPPFLRPTWVLVPDIIPVDSVGRNHSRRLTYPGIKEYVYVPSFKPDWSLRKELGITENEVLITVRPPATEAHYHRKKSEQLYRATMEFLISHAGVRIVLVPRSEHQAREAHATWSEWFTKRKIIIPARVVDGLNLICNSDLVVSGGGTMNREAAALRVPVYSIFGGRIGSVDRYLAREGRLVLLQSAEEVPRKIVVAARNRDHYAESAARTTLNAIVNAIATSAETGNHVPKVESLVTTNSKSARPRMS